MAKSGGRRVTTAEVAREAGLSRGTVSYALNGDPEGRLLPDTRERVLRAAAKLGYQPSAAARMLRGGRPRTILMLSHVADGFADPMARVVEALAAELAGHGYSLLWQLAVPGMPRPVGEVTPAVVLTSAVFEDPEFAEMASGFTVPVVEAFPGRDEFIGQAARAQVAHFAEHGHRRLAFVAPADPRLAALGGLRRTAALAEARSRRLPKPVSVEWPADESGRVRALTALRDHSPQITAVCAYNDEVALEVLQVAHGLGVAVPQRLAVIGADDTWAARCSWPALSSVSADMSGFVRDAAAHLAALARGEDYTPLRMPLDFVVSRRASS